MTTTYSLNISSQDQGMNSSTNVTTDNLEDLQRLLQLAGMHSEPEHTQAANPGYVSSADALPANVATVMQVDPATDMQNLRRMAGFGQDASRPECGESPCGCDAGQEQQAQMYENADHDHSENAEMLDDEGNPIDPEHYIYQGPKQAQRIAHMGVDNSLSETLFDHISQQWADFLAESLMNNEPGIMSPLSHTNRPDFDKDPTGNEKPVTDGSRSPMSRVKRQKVLQK
jgi:hypothetical protein